MNIEAETEDVCAVLLASYNGDPWISEQLKSIFMQEGVDVTLFVSDDMSTDSTLQILMDESKVSQRVRIVNCGNRNGSAGQNFMSMFRQIDLSAYAYIALSDQDDIWFPSKLKNGISKLKLSGAVGYSSSVLAFWNDQKTKVLNQSPNVRSADFLFEGAGQGCTFVLAADFFRQVQNFCIENEEITKDFYYHDWLVYLLCRCWGESWFFDIEPSMKYRQHYNNDTGARAGVNSFLTRFKLIKSGWYRRQIICAVTIAEKTCSKISHIEELRSLIVKPDSISRRLCLIFYIFRFGRRKFTDRFILVIITMLGLF